MSNGNVARLVAHVHGHVQGVGFRWWVRLRAEELKLAGSASNLPDGRVEVVAQGRAEACRTLLEDLRGPRTPGRVTGVQEQWEEPRRDLSGFVER